LLVLSLLAQEGEPRWRVSAGATFGALTAAGWSGSGLLGGQLEGSFAITRFLRVVLCGTGYGALGDPHDVHGLMRLAAGFEGFGRGGRFEVSGAILGGAAVVSQQYSNASSDAYYGGGALVLRAGVDWAFAPRGRLGALVSVGLIRLFGNFGFESVEGTVRLGVLL
jgi:hypothetical protein